MVRSQQLVLEQRKTVSEEKLNNRDRRTFTEMVIQIINRLVQLTLKKAFLCSTTDILCLTSLIASLLPSIVSLCCLDRVCVIARKIRFCSGDCPNRIINRLMLHSINVYRLMNEAIETHFQSIG